MGHQRQRFFAREAEEFGLDIRDRKPEVRSVVQRLKELERENERLKKLVAEQALDSAILKEVASGNF